MDRYVWVALVVLAHGAQHFGGHATYNGVCRHILRDNRTGGHHGAFANAHAVRHHHVGPNPDVVFDDNPLGGDALFNHGPRRSSNWWFTASSCTPGAV